MTTRPTAQHFLSSFLMAYDQARSSLSEELWEAICNSWDKWNRFMMYKTGPKPAGVEKSVLERTAEGMALEYYEREPLRLDGILHSKTESDFSGFPFPILIAIEHENDYRGFGEEIVKLLTVRSPLKVGITYTFFEVASNRSEKRERAFEKIRRVALTDFDKINQAAREDESSEYLFLVGDEFELRKFRWHAMIFSAGRGPAESKFVPAERARAA